MTRISPIFPGHPVIPWIPPPSPLEPMPFHIFMPLLLLGVEIQAGGVDAGVAGVALQELQVDPGVGLVGDAGVAEPVG